MKSLKELREICQPKDKIKSDALYIRVVCRRISIYLTALFLRLGITANQTSMLGLVLGLCGAFFLVFPSIGLNLLGAILLQIFLFLDCVDGELARYERFNSASQKRTISGMYLDGMGHIVLHPLAICFFGLGTAYHFPAWTRALSVLAVLGGFGILGAPNLGLADTLYHAIRTWPEALENNDFRVLIIGKKGLTKYELKQDRSSPGRQLSTYVVEFLFFPGLIHNIMLVVLGAFILDCLGLPRVAAFVELGFLCLLSLIYVLNLLRIFWRNFKHLDVPF